MVFQPQTVEIQSETVRNSPNKAPTEDQEEEEKEEEWCAQESVGLNLRADSS